MRSSVVDVLTARAAADCEPFLCVEDGDVGGSTKKTRRGGPGGDTRPPKKELSEEQKRQKQFQTDCDKILICTRRIQASQTARIGFTTSMLTCDLFHMVFLSFRGN